MKKLICISFVICILLSSLVGCGSSEDEPYTGPFVPVMRFAVCSDTHIATDDDLTATRTQNMIEQINQYAQSGADGYSKLDAFIFDGDITNNGTKEEMRRAHEIITGALMEDTKLVITTGNHEWQTLQQDSKKTFENIFGENCTMQDTVIGGYHFITLRLGLGWDYTSKYSKSVEKLIEAAIADTGKTKPIFIVQHIGNEKTVIGTSMAADEAGLAGVITASKKLSELYTKYENLVVFSGHTHFPVNDECSVWQGDYTAINTGTLYHCMRSIAGNVWIEMDGRLSHAQAHIVEMDAHGRMRLMTWDILQGKILGDEKLIPSFKKENFIYTTDRFAGNELFFAENAAITITEQTANSVTFSYPVVPKASISGRAYEIQLLDASGNVVSTKYQSFDYFNEDFDKILSNAFDNLQPDTDYKISIRALNSLYSEDVLSEGTLSSNAITVEFKTGKAE